MTTHRLVMCPYDEVHKVKESRLQLHITKCRLNHLHENKFTCPFNATHVYPYQEKDYHLSHCPDRAPLDRRLTAGIDANNPYKGRTAVPSYNESPQVLSEEVWDLDVNPTPGYKPPSETPSGVMFMPPPLSKPAERRKMYQNLHLRTDDTENRPAQPAPTPAQPKQPPIAQPKQPSEPSRLQTQMQQNFPNLGKGRGTSNRIAANFSAPAPAPNATSVAADFSRLGLGRGNNFVHPIVVNQNDDDEFPALGCGRGMTRAPRNNSYAGVMNAGNKQ